jgi:hypothetical protein
MLFFTISSKKGPQIFQIQEFTHCETGREPNPAGYGADFYLKNRPIDSTERLFLVNSLSNWLVILVRPQTGLDAKLCSQPIIAPNHPLGFP